jgi:hypothetical protein
VSLLGTGYSSCAGGTGPLFVPFTVTPNLVLLRSSLADGGEAVALARIDNGESGDSYHASIEFDKSPPAQWLTIDISGQDLTLHAKPDGLALGTFVAIVTLEGQHSGSKATLRVEYNVTD